MQKHRLKRFLLLSVTVLISGCAGGGGFQEVKFRDQNFQDIKIYGILDNDVTGNNFGGFRFIFENKRDQWADIQNIHISFPDDSAKKYIKVIDSRGLVLWSRAILQQQEITDSEINQLQAALLNAGSLFTGISIDEQKLLSFSTSEAGQAYPAGHVYAEEFMIPPNFSVGKWILFESTNHQNIPYLTDIHLDFEIDQQKQHGNLQFREKSSRNNSFIWFDPTRRRAFDLYLGVSVGTSFSTGDFNDMAMSKDYLINSFGVNTYTILLRNLGLNVALDYQSFQARAKLPFAVDSLSMLAAEYEFGSWHNWSLLISSRFVLPVNLKLDLFAELTGGVVLSRSPAIIKRRAGLEIEEIESQNSISLAAGIATGTRLYLSRKLSLDIKGEYIPYLKPNFKYPTPDNNEIEIQQNMSHFKLKASLNWDI